MKFFCGLHHPATGWPFQRAMLSAVTLANRKKDFYINEWILDSGAFSQISKAGHFTISLLRYARLIERWRQCGNLLGAVTQDWMCEEAILERTGLSVREHQYRTTEGYKTLKELTGAYIMPVLQGYSPQEYLEHIEMYGDALEEGAWCGVGSVCKRNGNPDSVEDVLLGIKKRRPDLRLHGFGIKITAIARPTVRALLESSDSMAWSYAGRREEENSTDPRNALRYTARVQELIGEPCFVQNQLFEWWKDADDHTVGQSGSDLS